MRWSVLAPLVAGTLALAAAPVFANGRAPLTNGITFKPGDDQSIYLATTFGLLVSHDDGCTFRWVCEQNIGYGGQWDPKYAVGTDGTIYATTFEGLRVSHDGACSFTTATSGLAPVWIDALDIGPTGEVWVGTAETAQSNDVFVSKDNGQSFSSKNLVSTEVWYKSVKVAPSRAQRIYATGYKIANTPTAYFYASDDDGDHWTTSTPANVMFAATPVLLIKAVDAANPDIVFMTSIGANAPSGDRLYRSADGGATWTEVLATAETIHDVVVQGQTVTIATQVQSSQALMGGPAYQSTDGGSSFSQLSGAPQLACVAARPDGTLLGCGANWDPDFKAVARSTDKGATWTKVWRFVETAGAVQCPAGTPEHDTCDVMLWDCPSCMTDLKRQFGAKGPVCGNEVVDMAGDPTPKKSGGCCDARSSGAGAATWSLVVGLLLLRRRRRR